MPEAADPILCQVPVGAGTSSARVAAVKAELVASAVVLGTDVGTWEKASQILSFISQNILS